MSDLIDIPATWQTHHVFVKYLFLAHLDNKQKSFVPKKNLRHVTIQDFKNQKIWTVTRVSACDYMV